MNTWNSMTDACDYYKIKKAEWSKVAAGLADESFDDIAMLVGVTTITQARVTRPGLRRCGRER